MSFILYIYTFRIKSYENNKLHYVLEVFKKEHIINKSSSTLYVCLTCTSEPI